ncbi:TAXI family TRAP transporter solute-binding subunit [Paracraurococcus lichenis]|uniref:TAXI family TRAP transporter solute-binding subunit n=1 Tax=Paracraurococcus lichenis TaxID=3064888 RepID=A0ABT9DUV0_9PROT|nr:TAXI family TRAP transporter solute-binding subunit [Paracraurococcus sp. LOR1-02]MDO9707676.1 TAXI family TRAP transporter solute-binding subunit [Paracraurococcus sp. LOR1-02]
MTLPRRSLLLAAALAGAAGPVRAQGAPPTLNALSQRANAGTVGIISGGPDGTYVRIAADLAAVLDDGEALRVLPILGKGSLQNIADILVLRGVDIGIVQSDVLAYARRERLLPGVDSLIQYVAKLYDEEVHVLAAPGIERIEDLAGKPVNVDVRGSGTAMTASLLFDTLGLRVEPRHDPQDTALEKLRQGQIAALVYVAGKPARLFNGIPADSGLHLLPVPATPALLETYLPAEFRRVDYPALVAEGATIETIAVGAVMAVYAWPVGTERHRKVARFVEAFTAKFPAFLQPPRHPKWREVNLAAQVPGWTRFAPAAGAARARGVAER